MCVEYETEVVAMNAKEVKKQAVALSPVERAALIEDLLASFEPTSRETVDKAWAHEAEDRVQAYEEGKIGSISLDESRRRLGAE